MLSYDVQPFIEICSCSVLKMINDILLTAILDFSLQHACVKHPKKVQKYEDTYITYFEDNRDKLSLEFYAF